MLVFIALGTALCLLHPDAKQLWKTRNIREWSTMCAVLLLAIVCAILQANGLLFNPVETIRQIFTPVSEQVSALLK